jgi:hypothetical protein
VAGVEDVLVDLPSLLPPGPLGDQHPVGLELAEGGTFLRVGGGEGLRGLGEHAVRVVGVQDERELAPGQPHPHRAASVDPPEALHLVDGAGVGLPAIGQSHEGGPTGDDALRDARPGHAQERAQAVGEGGARDR